MTSGADVVLSDTTAVEPTFTAPADPGVIKLQLLISDGKTYGTPDETIITVQKNLVNRPPVADAGSDQEVPPGEKVSLNGTGSSDPDGDALSYSWSQTAGAPVVLTGADTATPVFVTPAAPGDLAFSLTVYDGKISSKPDEVKVTVKAGNHVPVANAGPDQVVDVGALVTLDGTGSSDADGDTLVYQWINFSGAAVTLSDPKAAKPTFTAPAIAGDIVFRLIVSDGKATSTPDEMTIRVKDIAHNTPPVASAGQTQTVKPGANVYLNGTGSYDPDGDPITFAWTQGSGQAVVLADADRAIASFAAPQTATNVTLSFALVVNDGIVASNASTVIIYVVPGSADAPIADAGPSQRVNFSTPVTLDGSASVDPGGKALTYSWYQVSGPSVTLNNAAKVTADFTSPPPPNNAVLKFGLIVSNGASYSAPAETSVSVEDPRLIRPPTAQAGAAQNVLHGQPGQLQGAAGDPDGNPITTTWTQTAGPAVTLVNPKTLTPTFTAPNAVADLEFELTADDGMAQASSRTVVHVYNTPPTAVSTEVTLTGTGDDADAPDLPNLTYAWKNAGTVLATTRVATVGLGKGSHTLDFVVSDGLAETTDRVKVDILNAKPIANAGLDQFVAYPGTPVAVTLDGSLSPGRRARRSSPPRAQIRMPR